MKLSVVIPVYNSEGHIAGLLTRLHDHLQKSAETFEIICVNDGSADNTWSELIAAKSSLGDEVKVIDLTKNFGQHNATLCGLDLAIGEIVVTIDDDGRHPPETVLEMLDRFKDSDHRFMYVLPNRDVNTSRFRSSTSTIWKYSAKISGTSSGMGSSYRFFRKEFANQISLHAKSFVFIDEIIHWYLGEIPFTVADFGESLRKSNYSSLRLLKLGVDLALFYSIVPLKILAILGLLGALGSVLSGLYFIIERLNSTEIIPPWIIIVHVVMFMSSAILVSIGLFGQYIARIHAQLHAKPKYFIKRQA
jgi:undecaprenyl-phosphate 4-deoxy-4-formamido-L-arabinose transferase